MFREGLLSVCCILPFFRDLLIRLLFRFLCCQHVLLTPHDDNVIRPRDALICLYCYYYKFLVALRFYSFHGVIDGIVAVAVDGNIGIMRDVKFDVCF